jgi:hypothetical protein
VRNPKTAAAYGKKEEEAEKEDGGEKRKLREPADLICRDFCTRALQRWRDEQRRISRWRRRRQGRN